MLYYKMNTQTIFMCVVALLIGMLVANMLQNVCGCNRVEGFGVLSAPGEFSTGQNPNDDLRMGVIDKFIKNNQAVGNDPNSLACGGPWGNGDNDTSLSDALAILKQRCDNENALNGPTEFNMYLTEQIGPNCVTSITGVGDEWDSSFKDACDEAREDPNGFINI